MSLPVHETKKETKRKTKKETNKERKKTKKERKKKTKKQRKKQMIRSKNSSLKNIYCIKYDLGTEWKAHNN